MFDAEYLIFCEDKSVDDKNRLSLFAIFDKVYASDFPVNHPRSKAVFKLTPKQRGALDTKCRLKLSFKLKNKEISKMEAELPVKTQPDGSLVTDVDISPVIYPEAGRYKVQLYIDEEKLIERYLDVLPQKAQGLGLMTTGIY